MRSPFRSRWRIPAARSTALGLGVALAVGLLPQYAPDATARDGGLTRPATQTNLDDPVDGKDVRAKTYGRTNPAARAAVKSADTPRWPKAATDDVDLAKGEKLTRAKGLPLRVAASGKAGPASVRVAVLGREKSKAAGVEAPLLTVARSDGSEKSAPLRVSLDYADYAGAYGGSYGSRLRLVQYPSCVLTSPQKM